MCSQLPAVCESWLTYASRESRKESFHLCCLRRILNITIIVDDATLLETESTGAKKSATSSVRTEDIEGSTNNKFSPRSQTPISPLGRAASGPVPDRAGTSLVVPWWERTARGAMCHTGSIYNITHILVLVPALRMRGGHLAQQMTASRASAALDAHRRICAFPPNKVFKPGEIRFPGAAILRPAHVFKQQTTDEESPR
ncbi:unnamed protein product [Pleuronectes platessa]|uniref:Uncharacterized protein n=1 Tax=Pleuronectes platessa TaxID=8262 RepID=A0A9N7TIV9_PLEPL|nr:unnamed protein product [Pleuronectes platessa]